MDLYLDAEWFIGGDVFLIGWCRDSRVKGQLHGESLTRQNFQRILDKTTGKIYFYGPDIGVIEKFFDIDIRCAYHCVNLLKVFKDNLPGLKNYKLATIEKTYGVNRNRNEYKANIFSIFRDWRKPQVKSLVLQYNMEDVVNLCKLKQIIFIQKDITEDYLLQARLSGTLQVIEDHVYLLPCDVYRGKSFAKFAKDAKKEDPNITAQLVTSAKFFEDKVSRYRIAVLMADVVKGMKFDLITSVNGRDSKFNLAQYLAIEIGKRNNIQYKDVFYNHNTECTEDVRNRSILIIDDVIYKGTTMKTSIAACTQRRPQSIYFLAFGKSQRSAF